MTSVVNKAKSNSGSFVDPPSSHSFRFIQSSNGIRVRTEDSKSSSKHGSSLYIVVNGPDSPEWFEICFGFSINFLQDISSVVRKAHVFITINDHYIYFIALNAPFVRRSYRSNVIPIAGQLAQLGPCWDTEQIHFNDVTIVVISQQTPDFITWCEWQVIDLHMIWNSNTIIRPTCSESSLLTKNWRFLRNTAMMGPCV